MIQITKHPISYISVESDEPNLDRRRDLLFKRRKYAEALVPKFFGREITGYISDSYFSMIVVFSSERNKEMWEEEVLKTL